MTRLTNSRILEGDDFPFHIGSYEVKHPVADHAHEFVELVYVRHGQGRHRYDGECFPIAAGDVFVIRPESEHAYELAADSGGFEVFNVMFHPSFLADELKALMQLEAHVSFFYLEPFMRNALLFQCKLSLTTEQQIAADFLFRRLHAEYNGKAPGYRLLVKTMLIEILVTLSRFYGSARRHHAAAGQLEMSIVLERLCAFIAAHCDKPLTLEQASRMCGLGTTAFSAHFKRHSGGMTLIEYRNAMRIHRAQRLLNDTGDKIISIALSCGFDDISHFNRTFKQTTGMSPRQFRRRQAHVTASH